MKLMSSSFGHDQRIPEEFAFGAPDPALHVRLSLNRNPHLRWSGAPSGAKSLVLVCVDSDVPTRADDVNQEGRSVPATLPRTRFPSLGRRGHPADRERDPRRRMLRRHRGQGQAGRRRDRAGSRQGLNDYTLWFAGDKDMGGQYFGYDGPCPPWNDELLHHYHFVLYATDLARCPVGGSVHGPAGGAGDCRARARRGKADRDLFAQSGGALNRAAALRVRRAGPAGPAP